MTEEHEFYLKRLADSNTEEGSRRTYRFVCEPPRNPDLKLTLSFEFKGGVPSGWEKIIGEGTIGDSITIEIAGQNTQARLE